MILQGARQVGKTWLLKTFGAECFEDICYINFEQNNSINYIFEGSISPERIIEQLSVFHGKRIQPEKTLIIFDEVQEVPRALASLKYFTEEAPEYAIYGNLDTNAFTEKLQEHLKRYFIVGGMPAAVQGWLDTQDFFEVEKIQKQLLSAYSFAILFFYLSPDCLSHVASSFGTGRPSLAHIPSVSCPCPVRVPSASAPYKGTHLRGRDGRDGVLIGFGQSKSPPSTDLKLSE